LDLVQVAAKQAFSSFAYPIFQCAGAVSNTTFEQLSWFKINLGRISEK
jgi:hypothetical protein